MSFRRRTKGVHGSDMYVNAGIKMLYPDLSWNKRLRGVRVRFGTCLGRMSVNTENAFREHHLEF